MLSSLTAIAWLMTTCRSKQLLECGKTRLEGVQGHETGNAEPLKSCFLQAMGLRPQQGRIALEQKKLPQSTEAGIEALL